MLCRAYRFGTCTGTHYLFVVLPLKAFGLGKVQPLLNLQHGWPILYVLMTGRSMSCLRFIISLVFSFTNVPSPVVGLILVKHSFTCEEISNKYYVPAFSTPGFSYLRMLCDHLV